MIRAVRFIVWWLPKGGSSFTPASDDGDSGGMDDGNGDNLEWGTDSIKWGTDSIRWRM